MHIAKYEGNYNNFVVNNYEYKLIGTIVS